MSGVLDLMRPDLRDFCAYRSARREGGRGRIWLNANELPWPPQGVDGALNRYPEPQPMALARALAALYGVTSSEVLVTRGSDEGMDVVCRGFCRAGRDAVLVLPPTFGMYRVCAGLQGARVIEHTLHRAHGFRVDAQRVLATVTPDVRVVFLCSPNNPTGRPVPADTVGRICEAVAGQALVVLDEAYAEFQSGPDVLQSLRPRPDNLVVLRTLSKAHALAGARVGALVATPELVDWLSGLLPPYPLPAPSVGLALEALQAKRLQRTRERVAAIVSERRRLSESLRARACVARVYPSEGNFLLVACHDRQRALAACAARGVVVRDVAAQPGLEHCLRVTVGAPHENDALLAALEAA